MPCTSRNAGPRTTSRGCGWMPPNSLKLKPDVIFFTGGRVVRIFLEQTRSIPTVFVGVSDPLGQGLVSSLARPGGNLTGIGLPPYSITAKLVEILKQIASDVTRVALVLNPANPSTVFNRQEFEAAGQALAIQPSVDRDQGRRGDRARVRGLRQGFAGRARFSVGPDDLGAARACDSHGRAVSLAGRLFRSGDGHDRRPCFLFGGSDCDVPPGSGLR